jgi:catechol 2,3-dioxygenase-like lactoylglutathione lyase family enzyme
MSPLALDHVNIRTVNVEGMVAWYEDVLGLRSGPPLGSARSHLDGSTGAIIGFGGTGAHSSTHQTSGCQPIQSP